jgi:nucleoside-diphosphate-sugar epimerase
MMNKMLNTEDDLEERLSRPTEADAEAIRSLNGDLLILGAGGKMGPSLARLSRRAADLAGVPKRIVAVARFTNRAIVAQLESSGIETISVDLLAPGALESLPDIPNVIYMAARKFGTTGSEYLTWAMNTYLPGRVAERFRQSRIAAFSTGNVYPLVPVARGGAIESTPTAPVGEYAQSALGRERLFEYVSNHYGTPVSILRLNYAVELRYGVLLDIGLSVFERRPVDLRMGWVNVIWQGDANSMCLRSLPLCSSPPNVLNITGAETLSVRDIATRFAHRFGNEPRFEGAESDLALLNNAARSHALFGYPSVTTDEMIGWIAHWITLGGPTLNNPTRFEVQDGKF